ncbi:MAG: hypothetical protein HYY52_06660 [Candidatus Melainabacteria bacterium]|nr:hypothetical protein [Candidatus Melainabacteria bacterium]
MAKEINTLVTDLKPASRKNVIPITSLTDLGSAISEIQNQLSILIGKSEDDVSPEFKALMEGYINKANESEEIKAKLENIASLKEELKVEISRVRETNRNLINELQSARETLKNLESEFNNFQLTSKKTEQEYKDKLKIVKHQNEELENKIKGMTEEHDGIRQEYENFRKESLDQNYKFRELEQELKIQNDNMQKQLEEYEMLLGEQKEALEFKTKEIEYKDALLNQLVKQVTNEKLRIQNIAPNIANKKEDKRKGWFLG